MLYAATHDEETTVFRRMYIKKLIPGFVVVLIVLLLVSLTVFLLPGCQAPQIMKMTGPLLKQDAAHRKVVLPVEEPAFETILVSKAADVSPEQLFSQDETAFLGSAAVEPVQEIIPVVEISEGDDPGLALYRSQHFQEQLTDFYGSLTGSRTIASAILKYADKNDVPLSLAFSLAWAESEFSPRAVNKNVNTSIDRGLFQLNSRSFPQLSEEEFFNPEISARFGLAFLSHCLKLGGNEVVALAMYNAGPNRVDRNGTPRSTLNHVFKILTFRSALDAVFEESFSGYFLRTCDNVEARKARLLLDIRRRVK